MSVDFSKIYKRLSTTTWSVHDCGTVLDPDLDNRWCNKWRSTTRDVSSWWVPPFNVRMNEITFLDRMEVRIFSVPDNKYLIGGSYS